MAQHNELGKKGEAEAVALLKKKGYTILETNWRWQRAEIDIIVQKENTIAFVEVKTRSSDFFGDPAEQVTEKKRKLLAEAADHYISQKNLICESRFDIVSVISKGGLQRIRHIEEAFYPFQ
ncbi:MAG: YraN family protein [Bacteroidia bacterium]|nr:YraN family protein [Bacteroidia bacterium]MCZ2278453.1 YraN family protein [Bacteroidia bacterium]